MNRAHEVKPAATTGAITPSANGLILIVGGYGKVGLAIAERLAPMFPGRVTIAGRNLDKAQAAAAGIGHGTSARVIDIFTGDSGDALDGVALALLCLDQHDTRFAEQCLSSGIHYVDISADYSFLSQIEKLADLAGKGGATAILSVGSAPGLTNLLAARLQEKMASIDRLDILVELGLGDHHGRAAVEWMLDNLDTEYDVMWNGQPKKVRSFGESIVIPLPGQQTGRPAWRFNFSDQQVVAKSLGLATVSTWIRFDDRLSTWAFAGLSRIGFGRLLRRGWLRNTMIWLFMNVHMGSDIVIVAVRATGRSKQGADDLTIALTGRKQSLMTAIITAETVRQLLTRKFQPGIFHSEQVIALNPIIAELKSELPGLHLEQT